MYDAPTLAELVAAVRGFLSETARPQLTGHAAFHARVAENVLAIVERELARGEDARSAARDRLKTLLPDIDTDDLGELNRALCESVRAGEMNKDTPGLLAHLKATAIDALEIDQPRYSGLAIATKAGQD